MKLSVRKNIFAAGLALVLFLIICPAVFGYPINSGTYLFTMSGNTPDNNSNNNSSGNPTLQELYNKIMEDSGIYKANSGYQDFTQEDFEFYAKEPDPDSNLLTLTYKNDDKKSGTWDTYPNLIDFYAVKAGNQFAFYWVNPGASSGTWSTEDLTVGNGNQPDLSHFSAYRIVTTDTTNPVPEPATMILMGFGMIWLAGIGRRKLTTLAKKN